MSLLYINEECPVCGRQFKADDDIVTCPKCGTPHHRECYKSEGGCANGSRHSEGFVYKRAKAEILPNENSSDNTADNHENFYGAEGNKSSVDDFPESKIPLFGNIRLESGAYFDSDEEIDGVSLTDAAMVIGTNAKYFIPKFIKNKKISWNWSAFVFGPYYMFFRKMHMQGIMFLAIQFICRLVVSAVYSKQIFAFQSLYVRAARLEDKSAVMQAISEIPKSSEWAEVLPAYFIILACLLVLNAIIAVSANVFYRRKVINTVKLVNEKVNSGETFSISPMIGMDMNLNQADLKKLFLSKQGGVSIFAPVTAYFVLYFITMIVSNII